MHQSRAIRPYGFQSPIGAKERSRAGHDQPQERGGTDGFIPREPAQKLIAHAKEARMRIGAEDFFAHSGSAA